MFFLNCFKRKISQEAALRCTPFGHANKNVNYFSSQVENGFKHIWCCKCQHVVFSDAGDVGKPSNVIYGSSHLTTTTFKTLLSKMRFVGYNVCVWVCLMSCVKCNNAGTIELVTFNTALTPRVDHYDERRKHIGDAVRNLGGDIVCLQEVSRMLVKHVKSWCFYTVTLKRLP